MTTFRTHPIALRIPANSSRTVISVTSSGTIPESGAFGKMTLKKLKIAAAIYDFIDARLQKENPEKGRG